ncbi:hypothetical protein KM043_002497 [Ampulex compressa]|nr:hypothetical protein KM043_002497 [Ampulex compressa]
MPVDEVRRKRKKKRKYLPAARARARERDNPASSYARDSVWATTEDDLRGSGASSRFDFGRRRRHCSCPFTPRGNADGACRPCASAGGPSDPRGLPHRLLGCLSGSFQGWHYCIFDCPEYWDWLEWCASIRRFLSASSAVMAGNSRR